MEISSKKLCGLPTSSKCSSGLRATAWANRWKPQVISIFTRDPSPQKNAAQDDISPGIVKMVRAGSVLFKSATADQLRVPQPGLKSGTFSPGLNNSSFALPAAAA